MKQINTSVSTFRDLIEAGSLYVDKTGRIYELLNRAAGKQYFLSRPRRFGKSLTLTTLAEIFRGNRALFKGLTIDTQEYDWKVHPVVRLDISNAASDDLRVFKEGLQRSVRNAGQGHEFEMALGEPRFMFEDLIRWLYREYGTQVVVLIDEYDKPILNNADRPEVLPEMLRELKAFYSVVKCADEFLRFVFITGVSKFSKVSIFSDLNNLTDLTMDPRYADLCGYTQEELEGNFAEHIAALAKHEGLAPGETLAKIRRWYNGYRFSESPVAVYNPVSIGKLFTTYAFKNYWFETGTPTMLVNRMRSERFDIESAKRKPVFAETFSVYEVERLQALPLCFQTGYLTITEAEKNEDSGYVYKLDYPNLEVRASFTRVLLIDALQNRDTEVTIALNLLISGFRQGKLADVFQNLKTLFAQIPYDLHLNDERYYQSLFTMAFNLVGIDIAAEVRTSDGRIDVVVKNRQTIYIIEFKLNGTAGEALAQIREKRYYEPYLSDGREILLVGAEFHYGPEKRNIGEWKAEPLNQ